MFKFKQSLFNLLFLIQGETDFKTNENVCDIK